MKKLKRVLTLMSFFFCFMPYAFAGSKAELQWVFCENPLPDVLSALALPAPRKQTAQKIYYLETLNKDFELHRVFVKFKQRPNKKINNKIKSSVKVHFATEAEIPMHYKTNSAIECEKDVYVDVVRWGCAVKGEETSYALSNAQLHFLEENGVDRKSLQDAYLLGPLTGRASEITDDIEFEEMYTPSGLAAGEFSVRAKIAQADVEQKLWNERLRQSGLALCSLQSGKRQVVFEDLWRSKAYRKYD